jgi:ribonuclease Z
MRRTVTIALGAIALLSMLIWVGLRVPAIDAWIFHRYAFEGAAVPAPKLADANELSVLLCGTGSPLPDKTRGGPCTLIAAGGKYYLVDAGLDSARNLMLWRVPLEKIAGILVTHFHSDHIAELGELRLQTWVAGRKTPLAVYGPPGIERVVAGFNEAYALDAGYRTAHHGPTMLPPDAVAMVARIVPITSGATATVLEQDGLKITAIRVHHEPATPAYGYRFDFMGRSITVSGDTAADEDLARAAKGSDVLVHEALQPDMVATLRDAFAAGGRKRASKIFHDIPDYHTSPIEAARIANEAGAGLLVYTHIIPFLPNAIAERVFLRGVSEVRPDGVRLGHDGYIVRLPGNSKTIEEDDLN